MKDAGFEWDYRRGAKPRPTTPETRIADLDKDGVAAEIVYGCLMINEMIADTAMRDWADTIYNDWVADFAKKADPNRVFPLAIVPNSDPRSAAAEVRRCAKMGLRGGDLAFKRMGLPLWHHDWYALWEAVPNAASRSPSIPPASRRPAHRTRQRWKRNTPSNTAWCGRRCSRPTRWRSWYRCSRPAPARSILTSTSSWGS